MSKLNRLKFEQYNSIDYLITQEDTETHFRVMVKYPHVVGYDKKSNGYFVIHKRHSPSGLVNEIPLCVILKKLGYCVELCEEFAHKQSYDAKIDGVEFELKRLSKSKSLLNSIILHFRRAYEKCPNIVIHIDQKVDASNLRRAIRQASEEYKTIKMVLLIYRFKAIILNRDLMKKADYDL